MLDSSADPDGWLDDELRELDVRGLRRRLLTCASERKAR